MSAKSSIIKTIIKFIVLKFWPWFMKYGWPIVKEHIKDLIAWLIKKATNLFREWQETKSDQRQKEAAQKAQEAEKQAKDSSNENDADKYRAIAQVWREVAEQFRRDNEELKKKVDEFEAEAKTISDAEINKMDDLKIDFPNMSPVLKISGTTKKLPPISE